MANITIPDEFTDKIRAYEKTDPAAASLWNATHSQFLGNDVYLKNAVDAVTQKVDEDVATAVQTLTESITQEAGVRSENDNALSQRITANATAISNETKARISNYSCAVCSSASGTTAKTVTVDGFELKTGSKIKVNFTYDNSANNPTLNVNGTGAKGIRYVSSSGTFSAFKDILAGPIDLTYNGDYWLVDTTEKKIANLNSSFSKALADLKNTAIAKAIGVAGTTFTRVIEELGTIVNRGSLTGSLNPGGSSSGAAGYYSNISITANSNTGTYTYGAGSTGGTVDMGAGNLTRYVNASNVYSQGKTDGASEAKKGNAGTGDVLSGKTFTSATAGVEKTGTMSNNGAFSKTLNPGGSATGDAGYYSSISVSANSNNGTYTFPSGSSGGTHDMGTTNLIRYVNAENVYTAGRNDPSWKQVTKGYDSGTYTINASDLGWDVIAGVAASTSWVHVASGEGYRSTTIHVYDNSTKVTFIGAKKV